MSSPSRAGAAFFKSVSADGFGREKGKGRQPKLSAFCLDIGGAAYPTSQVPLRECREPFPTSISDTVYIDTASFWAQY